MPLTNSLVKSLAVGALAFTWSAPALYSQSSSNPNAVNFGMIGLAGSQTLRLNINAWPPVPVYPPDPIWPPNPVCIAQLGFANGSGGAVGPTKTVNLGAGQGDFLDLNGSTLMANPTPVYPPQPIRAEVRPVVTLLPPPGGGTEACLANAEIVDSFSGFTLVLAPGTITWPPQPIFGLQTIAWGQVLRLNVVAWPPDPIRGTVCLAQLSFADRLGNPAGPAPKVVNLTTGHADFLDIAGASVVGQFGLRAELRPVVTVYPPTPIVPGAAATSVCAATAEVYDQFTGRTWTWANPVH